MKILSKKKYNKLIEDFEELQKNVEELKRINESIGKKLEDKKTGCEMNNGKDFCFKCENSYRYKTYWGATEYALVLYRDKLPKFRNGCQTDENGKNIRGTGRMVFNWFTWEKDGKDIPKIHPAQKPVAVIKKLIEIFTDEGDVVIDPCCGSGSTLRAAAELGRSAYGFEIDRNFYERAKNEMLVFEKDQQMDISDFIGDTI